MQSRGIVVDILINNAGVGVGKPSSPSGKFILGKMLF
jgi:short-subunit dehydrogenase